MTGEVRLRLFKGECRVVGRRSPFALYDHSLATYDAGDQFDHTAAEGFIKLWGLPVETVARQAAKLAARRPGRSRRRADVARARVAGGHGRSAIVADWVGLVTIAEDRSVRLRTSRFGSAPSRSPFSCHMSHLWSGRFDGEPDPDVFEFGRSFPFDRRLFEDDVRGQPRLGGGDRRGRRDRRRRRRARSPTACAPSSSEGLPTPAFVDGPDEDVHAFVERDARRADRRGRASACTPGARATSRCRSICGCT